MKLRRTLLAAATYAAALGLAAIPSAAEAQRYQQPYQPSWMQPQDRERARERRGVRILSVREVAEIVRSQRGGHLLDVLVLEDRGDRPFYVLRWRSPDGRVEDLRVDALSGRVLGRVG